MTKPTSVHEATISVREAAENLERAKAEHRDLLQRKATIEARVSGLTASLENLHAERENFIYSVTSDESALADNRRKIREVEAELADMNDLLAAATPKTRKLEDVISRCHSSLVASKKCFYRCKESELAFEIGEEVREALLRLWAVSCGSESNTVTWSFCLGKILGDPDRLEAQGVGKRIRQDIEMKLI